MKDKTEERLLKMKKKCYICESEDVIIVFTPNRNHNIKHYYCKSCAKKYLKPELKKEIKRE